MLTGTPLTAKRGRFGSPRSCCALRRLNPFTVTARLGTVSDPVLRTVMAMSALRPSFGVSGKVAFVTSTSKSPSGSFSS